MKIRPNSLFLTSLLLALTAATHAATIQWVGDADANFANGANWATDPDLPSASADTWQINTEGDFGTTLTVDSDPLTEGNQSLTFTGTAGKIAFGASAPAMTLTGGDLSFFKGTGDTILLGTGSTVTQTVQNNLILGDGSGSTTTSVTNQSVTGGLLKITGNITAGTGGTPGATILSFGSTGTNNGNYEVTGSISKGATATSIGITKRGSGTLTLSGTNEVISLGQNEGSSKIVIAGGKTSILQTGAQQAWGGNRVDSSVKIASGAELYANDASGLRTRVEIDGGTLTVGNSLTETGMYWDVQLSAPGEVFTLKSGTVDYAAAKTGGYLRGFRLQPNIANQTISASQTGGQFSVLGGNSPGNVFTVGINTAAYATTSSYSLSGGVLDLKGQNGTSQGQLQINADSGGTSTTTFTLSGTGKLISRFNPGATSGGITGGANTDAKQIFALNGGTLVAGRIDAANLRGSEAGANGTIVNNGCAIAPGDAGFSGKTTVSGNLTITSGSLAFDIGGTAAATAWQDAAGSGTHDKLAATGTGVVVLGGTLNVSLIDSYEPDNGDVFYIIDGGDVSGTFSNLVGGRIILSGGDSFAVTIEGSSVFLSDYQPVPVGGDDYSTWATDNDIGGEPFDGDFDNDGISNGVEYALGKNPTVSSQPAGVLLGNTITFTKGAEAITNGDVSWVIETSTTLAAGSWMPEAAVEVGNTIAYTFTPGTPAKKFARLKVVQVP